MLLLKCDDDDVDKTFFSLCQQEVETNVTMVANA